MSLGRVLLLLHMRLRMLLLRIERLLLSTVASLLLLVILLQGRQLMLQDPVGFRRRCLCGKDIVDIVLLREKTGLKGLQRCAENVLRHWIVMRIEARGRFVGKHPAGLDGRVDGWHGGLAKHHVFAVALQVNVVAGALDGLGVLGRGCRERGKQRRAAVDVDVVVLLLLHHARHVRRGLHRHERRWNGHHASRGRHHEAIVLVVVAVVIAVVAVLVVGSSSTRRIVSVLLVRIRKPRTRVLAVHLRAERLVATLKEFMVVRTKLRTTSDAGKVPPVQLAGEAGVLGLAKVLGEDRVGKLLAVHNDECPAMRQPRDGIRVVRFGQNLHQSLGEDLGVLVAVGTAVHGALWV